MKLGASLQFILDSELARGNKIADEGAHEAVAGSSQILLKQPFHKLYFCEPAMAELFYDECRGPHCWYDDRYSIDEQEINAPAMRERVKAELLRQARAGKVDAERRAS